MKLIDRFKSKNGFVRGDRVSFRRLRNNKVVEMKGTIQWVNETTVAVNIDGDGRARIPYKSLSKI